MTQQERIAAYNRFHDFVCCFMEDQELEVNVPKADATAFEEDLVLTSVKMQNYSLFLGNYSAETTWKSSVGYESWKTARLEKNKSSLASV
ncbi:hypothetical protein V7S43_005302 [Phytophthora oleae]|uniref:PiggyBac transposable element-derived protein domain-containing protein n=1 Tax=Phytophthora oleae TaxID=2107226 RepID=A0ABD3FT72_9STRA